MTVYLDLVMLLNFLVDFLLLLGTDRLSGSPGRPWRTAAAAALGAVYSGACLLPGFHFLGNLLWRMVILGLMGAAAFGLDGTAIRRTAVFLVLAMALGGLAVSFGRGNVPSLLLAGGGLWLLSRVCFADAVQGREYVPLELAYGGKHLRLTALRDTGNSLRDPVTGEQVLVLSAEAAAELTGLSPEQLGSPLKTITERPIPGLRLIPYRAVGTAGGFLLGLKFPDARIGQRRQSVVAAFAPEGLGREEGFQALMGGVL